MRHFACTAAVVTLLVGGVVGIGAASGSQRMAPHVRANARVQSSVGGSLAAPGLVGELPVRTDILTVSPDGSLIYYLDPEADQIDQCSVAGGCTNSTVVAGVGASTALLANDELAISEPLGCVQNLTTDAAGNLLVEIEYPCGKDQTAAVEEDLFELLVANDACNSSCPYGLPTLSPGDIYVVAGALVPPTDHSETYVPPNGTPATDAMLFGSDIGADQSVAETPVTTDGNGDLFMVISDPETNARYVGMVAGTTCSASCAFGFSTVTGGFYRVASSSQGADQITTSSSNLYNPASLTIDSSGDLLIGGISYPMVQLVAARACSGDCPFGVAALRPGADAELFGLGGGLQPLGLGWDEYGDLIVDDTDDHLVDALAAASCSSSCPYGLATMTEGSLSPLTTFDSAPATSSATDGARISHVADARTALTDLVVSRDGKHLIAAYADGAIARLTLGRAKAFSSVRVRRTKNGLFARVATKGMPQRGRVTVTRNRQPLPGCSAVVLRSRSARCRVRPFAAGKYQATFLGTAKFFGSASRTLTIGDPHQTD